ncbi:MAG: O-antigen ligase family protein [Candidatus Marinimicrobia bacterium]|nr:O-antigen ligase family protein [Candidatus Neomarinimicrobiota bacterium]
MTLQELRKQLSRVSVTELLFYLYIFSIITLSGMPGGNLLSKLIGMAMVFYFVVYDILRNDRKVFYFREMTAVFVFVVAGLISGFAAKDQSIYLLKLVTIFQLTFFFFVGYQIIRIYNISIEVVFYLIIFSTVIVFLQGMVFSQTASTHLVDERLSTAQGNANALANFGAFSFLFLTYIFTNTANKFHKVLILLIAGFILLGILETESRKGMILVPIIVFVYVTLQSIHGYKTTENKRNFLLKLFLLFLGLLALLATVIFFITQTQYFDRFQQLSRFIQLQSGNNKSAFKHIIDYSTYERRQFIKYGLVMWKNNFWIGVGLDNFRSCINEYWISSRQTYSHNNYVEILSTTGIIGGMAYYGFYYLIIANIFQVIKIENITEKERSLLHIFLTGMFSLLIAEMVIITYYMKFFWLIYILLIVYTNQIKTKYNA